MRKSCLWIGSTGELLWALTATGLAVALLTLAMKRFEKLFDSKKQKKREKKDQQKEQKKGQESVAGALAKSQQQKRQKQPLWSCFSHNRPLSEVLPDSAAAAAQASDTVVRDYLLDWCNKSLTDYPDLRVENFSSCWSDGRAFLYLIHRFRPSLVDPSRVPKMSAEERLRLAFELNERHLGVSSLLDPEDVTVAEPDERSLITYVSSIYDMVAENRSQQQQQQQQHRQRLSGATGVTAGISDSSWDEYRRSAQELLTWLRQATSAAASAVRDIGGGGGTSLSQLRSMAERLEAQRAAEVEQRVAQKDALVRRYDELLVSVSGSGAIGGHRVEPELRPDHLERSWERYCIASKERQRALQQRIAKLERLYILGDSVRYGATEADAQLRTIQEELHRLAPDAHPMDAETALRSMTSGLAAVGQQVDQLFSQVQELREEQYSQAEHLYHRLCSLHLSYLDLNRQVDSAKAKRASRTGSSTSQQFRRHAEQLMQQSSASPGGFYDDVANVSQAFSALPAYADLRRCMAWIRQREDQLRRSQQLPAGADLAAVRDIAEFLRRLCASVIDQRAQINACEAARAGLAAGEERETFDRLLAELDSAYRALLQAANRRQAETEELLAFMESAEAEVAWLVEKEAEVLGHDWGTAGLDTDDVEVYFKKLMESLESREAQFNAVIGQGAELRRRGHPAEATVHETTARMEQQWTWFLSLTNCLEHHLEMAVRSGQFFAIARELNDWTEHTQQRMSSDFLLHEGHSSEEGQEMLRSLRAAREQLLQKSAELEHLNGEAAHLAPVPIKRNQRYESLKGAAGARTLCGFQHLAQGEPLELLDASGPKCLARPRQGPPVWLPALCIRLSGPCPEACDAAKKLGTKFQHLEKLMQRRELRLREQLVHAAMTSLLQQSQEELAALPLEHRRALLDSLNQDAGKLLLDMKVEGITPLDSQAFTSDLEACNDAFFRLARGAGRFADSGRLQEELERLDSKLASFEARMRALTSAGGPDDLASLEAAVTEQNSLESQLSGLEWEMNYLRQRLQQELGVLPESFQLLERRRASVWDVAHEQVRRLQSARDFLAQLEGLASRLAQAEQLLTESRIFPVREAELHRHLTSLRNVQQILEAAQVDLRSAEAAQQLSKLARPTGERWRRLNDTAEQRLALLGHCRSQFDDYMRLAKQFSVWLAGCHRRLQAAAPNDPDIITDVGKSAEQAAADLASLNSTGNQLIEVARNYDFFCRSGSGSSSECGAEQLQEELARLNSDFLKLVASLERRQLALQAIRQQDLSLANAAFDSGVGSNGDTHSGYKQVPKHAVLTNTPSPVFSVANQFATGTTARDSRDGWSVVAFSSVAGEAVQEAGTALLVGSDRALPLTQLRSPVQLTASTTVSPVAMATVHPPPALQSHRSGAIDPSKMSGEETINFPRPAEELPPAGFGKAQTKAGISGGNESIARPGEFAPLPGQTTVEQEQSKAAAMAAAMAEKQQQQQQQQQPQLMQRKRRLTSEEEPGEETVRKQQQQQQQQGQQLKALRIDTFTEASALSAAALSAAALSAAASRPAATAPTLNELLTRGLVDETSGLLVLPLPGAPFTIAEALNRCLIDPRLSTIVDPDTGAQVPLDRAIATGLLNPDTGSVRCRSSGQNLTFADAILEGLVPEETPMATGHMTFEEALSRGFVDYKRNMLELPGRPAVPIDRAIAAGWIDPPQSVTSVRSKERRTPTSLNEGSSRSAIGSRRNADTASEGSELTDVTQLPGAGAASGGPFLDSPAPSSSMVTSTAGSELSVLASTLLARRTVVPAASAPPGTDPTAVNLSGSKTSQSSQQPQQQQQHSKPQSSGKQSFDRKNGADAREDRDDGRPAGAQPGDIVSFGSADSGLERNCVLDMLCLKHGSTKMPGRVTNQMLVSGDVDLASGTLKDPESLQRITIVEAIQKRSAYATVVTVGRGKMYVEQYDSRHHMHEIQGVYDSYNRIRVSVFEALERGLIDPVRATYLDTKTGEVSVLTDAIREGQVQTVPLSRAPSSLTHPFDNYHARTVEEELNLERPRKLPKDVRDSLVSESKQQTVQKQQPQPQEQQEQLVSVNAAATSALNQAAAYPMDSSSQPQRFRLGQGYELTANGQVKDPSGALISLETAEKLGILTVAGSAADPMSQVWRAVTAGCSLILWLRPLLWPETG